MHDATSDFLVEAWDTYGPFDTVLDLGGRDINGTARDYWPARFFISVDISDGPGVDVIGDVLELDLGRTFDAVVCTNVLEHVADWPGFVACARRHLDGGVFVVTTVQDPFPEHSGHDGLRLRRGEHYRNVAPDELRLALKEHGFEVLREFVEAPEVQFVARPT